MKTQQIKSGKTKNTITQIFEHDISWWVYDNKVKELDDSTIEHIESYVAKGFTSGELCISYGKNHEKEVYGWWDLVNWRDIALTLYNAIDADPEAKKKAKEVFDETWEQL